MKESVIHMTIRDVDVEATIEYTDETDAGITRLVISGEGGSLLRAGVFAEIEDHAFAALPGIQAGDGMDLYKAELEKVEQFGKVLNALDSVLTRSVEDSR